MKTNPNDSAFANAGNTLTGDNVDTYSSGLTKREIFAAMAMQPFLNKNQSFKAEHYQEIAKRSVAMADALITELNKAQ